MSIDHFSERADLPSNLVDGEIRIVFVMRVCIGDGLFGKEDKGVVIGAVSGKKTNRGSNLRANGLRDSRSKIQMIRDFKAQKSAIKVHGLIGGFDIDAEVPKASDLKRALKKGAVNVNFVCGHVFLALLGVLFAMKQERESYLF